MNPETQPKKENYEKDIRTFLKSRTVNEAVTLNTPKEANSVIPIS